MSAHEDKIIRIFDPNSGNPFYDLRQNPKGAGGPYRLCDQPNLSAEESRIRFKQPRRNCEALGYAHIPVPNRRANPLQEVR